MIKFFRDPSYNHCRLLETAMKLHTPSEAEVLLAKFALLQDSSFQKIAEITKTSMITGFHSVFGYGSRYIAERIFDVLTGPNKDNVTKIRWLTELHPIMRGNGRARQNFGFALYNSAGDGLIRSNDVSTMLSTLPVDPEM
jgi:hypothetical protein